MQQSLGLQEGAQSAHINAKLVPIVDVEAPVDGVNAHTRDIPS